MNVFNKKGLSLIEMMMSLGLFILVSTAGTMLFNAGQYTWSVTDSHISIGEGERQILLRLSQELQQSGKDKEGALQIFISDNTGVNGSDVLRFSIPICVCGTLIMDENGDVNNWGAPLTWGQSGCGSNYTVVNGEVEICHVHEDTSTETINVLENEVKGHLAHGDWLGDCNSCDPLTYTNRTIEYSLDGNNNLLRKILNASNSTISSVVFAENIIDFQANFNGSGTAVTLTIDFSKSTTRGGVATKTSSINVVLLNL